MPALHLMPLRYRVRPTGASFRDAASGIVDANRTFALAVSTALPRVPTACALSIRSVRRRDKCDFCRKPNFLKAGQNSPACVESCPTKALTFGNLDDPNSDISPFVAGKVHPIVTSWR
ncbi:hypothetical protein KCP73_10125 [Salmonella enterica subsp. enterica]|nr:hypothetical protein KCP73_10125 [Salmonella enterica subsp. enterica]